jgi:hypothetical protein
MPNSNKLLDLGGATAVAAAAAVIDENAPRDETPRICCNSQIMITTPVLIRCYYRRLTATLHQRCQVTDAIV